jgi:AcrR family transcriptional regulator
VANASPDLPEDDDDPMRAADGRVPGRRGRATRQRLLEQTAEMLKASSYRDLKVVDIARGAGTSPATFYQYFPEVESAILVLAEEISQDGSAHLAGLVRDGNWRGKAAWDTSINLVNGVMSFWEANRAVLRVVELATDEGDQRFRKTRVALLNGLTNALAEVIEAAAKAGRHPADLDPMATAGVLVSMLAHVAAHRYGFEFWGIRTDDLERSMARIVFTTITGQKPPADA